MSSIDMACAVAEACPHLAPDEDAPNYNTGKYSQRQSSTPIEISKTLFMHNQLVNIVSPPYYTPAVDTLSPEVTAHLAIRKGSKRSLKLTS